MKLPQKLMDAQFFFLKIEIIVTYASDAPHSQKLDNFQPEFAVKQ